MSKSEDCYADMAIFLLYYICWYIGGPGLLLATLISEGRLET